MPLFFNRSEVIVVKFIIHCHSEKEGGFGRGWLLYLVGYWYYLVGWLSLYRQKRTYQAIYFYLILLVQFTCVGPTTSGYLHFPSWFDHFFDCIVTYHHVRLQSQTYLYYVLLNCGAIKKKYCKTHEEHFSNLIVCLGQGFIIWSNVLLKQYTNVHKSLFGIN